jgi:hypothetical protein
MVLEPRESLRAAATEVVRDCGLGLASVSELLDGFLYLQDDPRQNAPETKIS